MNTSEQYIKFGLKPFWFWNGDMDDDCIVRQIDEMKEKGLGGFFIHPRQGLKIPYLSEKWFGKVGIAIERAKKVGLEVWLYDEYPYPSGIAAGEVTAGHPEYEARILKPYITTVQGPSTLEMEMEFGKVLGAVACPVKNNYLLWEKRIDIGDYIGIIYRDEIFLHGGLSRYNNKRYFTGDPAKKLIWPVPSGTWKVFVFIECRVRHFKYFGTFIDPLNRDAIARFINLTHEQYKKHFGSEFGKTIKGIFTDETAPFGNDLPWSPLLPELFLKKNGYDITGNLPALFDNIGPGTDKIRYDYWNTAVEAFIESYDKQIHEWCIKNNLLYAGEKDILRSSHIQHMDIPGIDAGHDKTGAEPGIAPPRYRSNGKLLSSGCHFYEKERCLCECFHSTGWGMTIQDMKWMLDWLVYEGIDMFVPHGFFYTTDGLKKHDAPPSQFFQMPWWKHMDTMSGYIVSLADTLSKAERKVDALVLDPVTSTWTAMGEKQHLRDKIRNDFSKLQKALISSQLDYYIIDPQLLARGIADSNGITVKDETYRVLVIPPALNIEKDAWKVIKEYMEKGGVTVFTGCLPIEAIDGYDGAKNFLDQFFGTDSADIYRNYAENKETKPFRAKNTYFVPAADDVPGIVAENTDGCIRILCDRNHRKNILAARFSKNEENIYFLVNTSAESFECDIVLPDVNGNDFCILTPGPGKTGRRIKASCKNGKPVVSLSFKPFESLLITDGENTGFTEAKTPAGKIVIGAEDEWDIRLTRKNALRLGKWALDIFIPLKGGRTLTYSSDTEVDSKPMIQQIADGNVPVRVELKTVEFGCRQEIALPEMTAVYTSKFIMDNVYAAWLVMEPGSIDGKWYAVINGEKITPDEFTKMEFYLETNLAADISGLLRKGENTIKVYTENQPQTGGLANPLYLFGDFGVYRDNNGIWHINGLTGKGRLNWRCECGFPFYAGEISYSREIEIVDHRDDEVYEFAISDNKFQDSVTMTINGHDMGTRCWSPYVWHVDGKFLNPGKNVITLQVSTTLLELFEGQTIIPVENRILDL